MTRSALPPFLHPQSLALVAVGGALGAAAREAAILAMPGAGPVPWAVLLVNILGAFLLGYLYEALTRTPGLGAGGPRLRLLLGTGFCGGLTTFSTLATGTVALAGWASSSPAPGLGWAAGYALGTVVVGAFATWCGILAGSLRPSAPATAPVPEHPADVDPDDGGGR